MKSKDYLITYHNDLTGKAIWVTEKYCFQSTDVQRFWIMKGTNELIRSPGPHTDDVIHGIRLMLKCDGQRIDDEY